MIKTSEESKNFPARPDKTIDWLNKSRDDWKGSPRERRREKGGRVIGGPL